MKYGAAFASVALYTCTFTVAAAFSRMSLVRRQQQITSNVSPRNLRAWSLSLIKESELLEKIREGVSEAGFEEAWKGSVDEITSFVGIDVEHAEMCLAQALEWKAWAMAPSPTFRKYIKTKEPIVRELKDNLSWMVGKPLQLEIELLKQGILQFPGVYLVDSQVSFEKAISCAPIEYKSIECFRNQLAADLSILKNTYNCDTAEEGCAGNCGSCWVTYGNKKL
jgi:hypothetical protein